MRWLVLAALACHAQAATTHAEHAELAQGATDVTLVVYLSLETKIIEQIDLKFDPKRGMTLRFATASGNIEWSCDGSRSIELHEQARCFVERSCDVSIQSWLHVGWRYADLAAFVSGQSPPLADWEIRHWRPHSDPNRTPTKSVIEAAGGFPGAAVSWGKWQATEVKILQSPPSDYMPCQVASPAPAAP